MLQLCHRNRFQARREITVLYFISQTSVYVFYIELNYFASYKCVNVQNRIFPDLFSRLMLRILLLKCSLLCTLITLWTFFSITLHLKWNCVFIRPFHFLAYYLQNKCELNKMKRREKRISWSYDTTKTKLLNVFFTLGYVRSNSIK